MTFNIRVSTEISSRAEIPLLLNSKGLVGTAAEVGVWRGDYANQFLHAWKGKTLLLIDNYARSNDYPESRELDKAMAEAKLAGYKHRIEWMGEHSLVALGSLYDNSLDAVNIDACHEHPSVAADMEMALKKIRPGGLIFGHDWHYSVPGVVRAVKEFSAKHELEVFLTSESETWWSWYCWKPANFVHN